MYRNKVMSNQLIGKSEYIFCEKVSFTVRSSVIRYVLNILNANFKAKFREKRTILNQIGCQIKVGTLNAILGISGSGKSTLLKALLSKEPEKLPNNYNGNVFINQWSENTDSIYLSFIGQEDRFHEVFTIREIINMAFELKYRNPALRERILSTNEMLNNDLGDRIMNRQSMKQQVVDTLIGELNLKKSADNKIQFCSGGEKKRLSLAVELIALPDILLLDEPTTGLDSSTSMQIVTFLKKLTKLKKFTAVAAIHQPSFKLFNKFGNVIIQSRNGHIIFNGPPNKIPIYLKEHGLNCPKSYNPADYIIDVANGDFGENVLEKLINFQRKRHKFMIDNQMTKTNQLIAQKQSNTGNLVPLSNMVMKSSPFYWSHLYYLTMESIRIQLTDRLVLTLKAINYLMNLLAFHLAFGLKNGKYDGCPNYDLIKTFNASNLHELIEYNKDQAEGVMSLTGNIYFTVFIACYCNAAIPAFTVPNELKVMLKQRNNLWYSLSAYFFSRTLADLPITIAYVVAYATLNWYVTGIVAPFDRYLLLMFCYIIVSIWTQSLSNLVGCVFIDSVNAAVYLTLLGSIPMIMFAERIKLVNEDWNFFIWIMAKFSFNSYQFKAMVLSLFGNSRCGDEYKDLFVNYTIEIKDWLNYYLDVNIGDNNSTSGISEKFSNTLLKLINGEYFNSKNPNDRFEFRSMALNKLEIPDYNIAYLLISVFAQALAFKILALALIYYFTKSRFV